MIVVVVAIVFETNNAPLFPPTRSQLCKLSHTSCATEEKGAMPQAAGQPELVLVVEEAREVSSLKSQVLKLFLVTG